MTDRRKNRTDAKVEGSMKKEKGFEKNYDDHIKM
jgi:hypothetical protein